MSGTVLVVDDEAVVRSVARAALEGAGFDVITAGRGEEALALFQQHNERLSAIVLDLDMPGMDGNETYHLIRQISGRVPIILMSGYGQTGAAKRFATPGAVPFLPKPFAPRGLLDQIYRSIGATSEME